MLFNSRPILTAIVLAASVTVAQAQTTSDQDHSAHHPQTEGSEQVQTPPAAPMGKSVEGSSMPGMMQSGRRPGGAPAMMGADMSQMMEMMRRMMGTMMGPGEPGAPLSSEEGSRMGEMMQSMGQMMGTMGRMMEERGMNGAMPMPSSAPVERRIDMLKSALAITEAQMPQWTAFTDALRSGAEKARAAYAEAVQGGTPTSAPDRAELRVKQLSTMLDALKATVGAEKSLYAVLSDEQKHTADELLSGPFGRM